MEWILVSLPQSTIEWTIVLCGSLIGSLVAMSFAEYYLHGYVLHRRILPEIVYRIFPALERELYEHSVLHHETYFSTFNNEPDPRGRALPQHIGLRTAVVGVLLAAPALAGVGLLWGIIPVAVFAMVGGAYILAWNLIHPEMHMPTHPWWSRSAAYRFLARYHYLHHERHRKRVRRNMNLVLPFADIVLGTYAAPDAEDRQRMRDLGYL